LNVISPMNVVVPINTHIGTLVATVWRFNRPIGPYTFCIWFSCIRQVPIHISTHTWHCAVPYILILWAVKRVADVKKYVLQAGIISECHILTKYTILYQLLLFILQFFKLYSQLKSFFNKREGLKQECPTFRSDDWATSCELK